MARDSGVVSVGEPGVVGGIRVVGAGLAPCSVGRREKTSGGVFVSRVGESRKASQVKACRVSDIGRAFEVGRGIANEERGEEGGKEAKRIDGTGKEEV